VCRLLNHGLPFVIVCHPDLKFNMIDRIQSLRYIFFLKVHLQRITGLSVLVQSNFRMGNRSESFSECAQVRTKMHRKDWAWSVRLVYDLSELSGVITIGPIVVGVLQMISEPTLVISRAHMGQLKRIWCRTGQGHAYVRMTRGTSVRDTIWYVCY
jgi:hypothetical protein